MAYYRATGDAEFPYFFGAELMFVIARFWASIAQLNEARGRYDIRGVIGPDEFHDRLKIVPRNPVAPQIDTLAFSVMVDARRL